MGRSMVSHLGYVAFIVRRWSTFLLVRDDGYTGGLRSLDLCGSLLGYDVCAVKLRV